MLQTPLKEKNQAQLTEEDLVAIISEVNMVDMTELVVDTGATKPLCSNKDLLSNFELAEKGEQVYMENMLIWGTLASQRCSVKEKFSLS